MSFFSSIFGPKRTESEQLVINHLEKGAKILLQHGVSNNREGSHFEALIISALYLLKTVQFEYPAKYSVTESLVFKYLREYSNNVDLPATTTDFLNQRMEMYVKELDGVRTSRGEIVPTRTLFCLFKQPLMLYPGENLDISADFGFKSAFMSLLEMNRELTHRLAMAI